MLKILLSILLLSASWTTEWHHDLREAENVAKNEHRLVLLNFSGSDWCGPCIRMHKEVFESNDFRYLADSTLVLVNADFPRMSRNQLPAKQQQLNNAMADQYNPKGKFPLTVLLTADGKVLRAWDGFPDGGAAAFTEQLHSVIAGNR
ncbi:MAG TPA: thioredoxin family protein [Puia sp.]|nr:thioredoxin family protein [Puia sp.]